MTTDQAQQRVISNPELPAGGSDTSRLRGVRRFYLGLVPLFIASATIWAALAVSVPALWPGWTALAITSDSMAPSIRRGDIVIAAPYGSGVLGPGSVIVFEDPGGGSLLTHRVVEVNGDGSYLTQGDANGQPDSTPVHPEQVIGVGRFLVPFFGLPMVWAQQGDWVLVAVWVGVVSFVVFLSRHAFTYPNEAKSSGG